MARILSVVILSLFLAVNLFAQEAPKKPTEENTYIYNSDKLIQTKTTTKYDAAGKIAETILTEYTYYDMQRSNEKITTIKTADASKQIVQFQYNYLTGDIKTRSKEVYELSKGKYRITFKKSESFVYARTVTVNLYEYDPSGTFKLAEQYDYELNPSGKKIILAYTRTKYVMRRGEEFLQEENTFTYMNDYDDKISQVKVVIVNLDDDINGARYYIFNPDGTVKEFQFEGKFVKISKAEQEAEAKLILEVPTREFAY
jgi:hypothetical protein